MKSNLLNSLGRVFEGVIIGILTFFIPIIYPFVLSFFNGVSFKQIIFVIPSYVYFILLLPFIFWIIVYCIRSKMKKGISSWGVFSVPYNGYKIIGGYYYKDLLWEVQVPNNLVIPFYEESKYLDEIHIKYPPRCPNCKTELDFSEHWLWYTWECIDESCGFIKRTWNSTDILESNVKKLVKREIEKDLDNKKR